MKANIKLLLFVLMWILILYLRGEQRERRAAEKARLQETRERATNAMPRPQSNEPSPM